MTGEELELLCLSARAELYTSDDSPQTHVPFVEESNSRSGGNNGNGNGSGGMRSRANGMNGNGRSGRGISGWDWEKKRDGAKVGGAAGGLPSHSNNIAATGGGEG